MGLLEPIINVLSKNSKLMYIPLNPMYKSKRKTLHERVSLMLSPGPFLAAHIYIAKQYKQNQKWLKRRKICDSIKRIFKFFVEYGFHFTGEIKDICNKKI